MIDDDGINLIVPYGNGKVLITQLEDAKNLQSAKKILTDLQRYTVQVYKPIFDQIKERGGVRYLEWLNLFILEEDFYDDNFGVSPVSPLKFQII